MRANRDQPSSSRMTERTLNRAIFVFLGLSETDAEKEVAMRTFLLDR